MSLDPQPLAPALGAAEEAGWTVLRLDLRGVAGKAGLMRRCGEAFRLPQWFGGNWDALADALGDLSWLPEAPGRLVAVTSWREYADAQPGEWETLRDVLEGAVDSWREEEPTFAVVLAEPARGPRPGHRAGPDGAAPPAPHTGRRPG
ncbi:barstar family protein [Streptomyces sp. CB00455]|uniref:barstar family protein n=1 Tax=Streptomyces sp. CB00455 TaxID=1703927 RepID=UPI0009A116D9|nr:barstar family protein [Streptomyces sp. CB00455]